MVPVFFCPERIMSQDRVVIFDTTLRDGEQSPGASMNLAEKLEVAMALRDLGVDVIEAGFPIASPGDFEAVREIARQVHGPSICGLARCNNADIDPGKPLKTTPNHASTFSLQPVPFTVNSSFVWRRKKSFAELWKVSNAPRAT